MKRFLIAAAIVVIAVLAWRIRPTAEGDSGSRAVSSGGQHPEPRAPNSNPQDASTQPKTQNSKSETTIEGSSHLADTLNSPSTDIREDLRIVDEIIGAFRTNFPRDGNPVGDNAEITAALTGQNALRFAFIPPDHPAINKAGELCDRWGTPFFFHAESSAKMAIRSAGPDKKLYTADDVVFAP